MTRFSFVLFFHSRGRPRKPPNLVKDGEGRSFQGGIPREVPEERGRSFGRCRPVLNKYDTRETEGKTEGKGGYSREQ